jgi:hypothetical protein
MPKVIKYDGKTEYVFLSESAKYYIFRFRKKNKEKLVLSKKEDALENINLKVSVPLKGDFTWSYSMLFGRKGVKWQFLGEL